MSQYTSHALAIVLGGLIVAAGCAYLKLRPSLPSVSAVPAKELANETLTTLPCKPVAVYRPKVKEKLGIPEPLKSDPKVHIAASANIPASEYPHTATAIFSEDSGATNIYLRRDPLPWLSFTSRWRLGGFYGANDEKNGVFLGLAQYEFVQLKRLKITAIGQADTSSRYFVGAGVTW